MSYTTGVPKKKRRGGGGCCGCFFLVLAVLVGLFFAARKWAPNRLVQAEGWARQKAVAKYPVLDRWIPAPTKPTTSIVPVATAPLSASPTPAPIPAPASAKPLGGFDILSQPPPFTEVTVGTGPEAQLGQTVVVRYGTGKTPELPETFMLGATETTPELEAVVRGMKVGGKRKLGELEVELVKIL